MLPLSPSENEREQADCLILVDELGFFKNMFLRFAVAFLEYSENLHLIRGEKKKRVPENKKHQSETVYCSNNLHKITVVNCLVKCESCSYFRKPPRFSPNVRAENE